MYIEGADSPIRLMSHCIPRSTYYQQGHIPFLIAEFRSGVYYDITLINPNQM